MDLTDQQWQLLQPLFNEHYPQPTPRSLEVGGRPPIDPRPILDAILWKIRNNAPWYDLPRRYPSYQTAYLACPALVAGTLSTLEAHRPPQPGLPHPL